MEWYKLRHGLEKYANFEGTELGDSIDSLLRISNSDLDYLSSYPLLFQSIKNTLKELMEKNKEFEDEYDEEDTKWYKKWREQYQPLLDEL